MFSNFETKNKKGKEKNRKSNKDVEKIDEVEAYVGNQSKEGVQLKYEQDQFSEEDRKCTLDEYLLKATSDCYNSFDRDGSEYITPHQITSAFASFDIDIDADDSQEIIDAFDTTGHGHIEFQDFYREMHETMINGTTEEHLRMVFDMMDQDKDGFIRANEIISQFQNLGTSLEANDAVEAVDKIATDGYGQIDFSQFKSFCHQMEKANLGMLSERDSNNMEIKVSTCDKETCNKCRPLKYTNHKKIQSTT